MLRLENLICTTMKHLQEGMCDSFNYGLLSNDLQELFLIFENFKHKLNLE